MTRSRSRTPARAGPAGAGRPARWRWVVAVTAGCVGLTAAALTPAADRGAAAPVSGHARGVTLDGLLTTTAYVPADVHRCCP
jgi:hypothetical protein